MRKWTLIHIIILVLAPTMRAELRLHNLVVKFCNEQTIVFTLKDKPIATLHADSLHIQTAQFEASYLRIEMVDSTIVLPVADIQRFAFDYVNEAEQDSTVYVPWDDLVAQKRCVLLDLSLQRYNY